MLRTRRGPRLMPCGAGASAPLRRCSSLRRRPCTGLDCSDANYRETVARLRMLLMDSYLPYRLDGDASDALVSKSSAGLADFIARQEEYIQQLEKESRYCRGELTGLMMKLKDLISENEELMTAVRDSLAPTARLPLPDTQGTRYNMDLIRPQSQSLREPSLLYESRISELQAQLMQARMESQSLRLRTGLAD